jgi:hypothetical protein
MFRAVSMQTRRSLLVVAAAAGASGALSGWDGWASEGSGTDTIRPFGSNIPDYALLHLVPRIGGAENCRNLGSGRDHIVPGDAYRATTSPQGNSRNSLAGRYEPPSRRFGLRTDNSAVAVAEDIASCSLTALGRTTEKEMQ